MTTNATIPPYRMGHRARVEFVRNRRWWQRALTGYLFASPWVVGFVAIYLIPLGMSIYWSFTNFGLLDDPKWVGLENYSRIFAEDPRFGKAIYNTLYYTLFSVPLCLVGSLLIALLLNRQLPAVRLVRTIVYLPAVMSGVAMALAWRWMLNPNIGAINWILNQFGVNGPTWLYSVTWSKPAFILMSFWGVGPSMIIFLAALQNVPQTLHEAAEIDGANVVQRFFHVTMPMISPAILFNMITLIINSFKIFTPAWVLTSSMNATGTPGDSTLFYVLYLFWKAFVLFELGYASAMAWLLTLVMLIITGIQLMLASRWVVYETV